MGMPMSPSPERRGVGREHAGDLREPVEAPTYPGLDYQIEVYSPDPAQAPDLTTIDEDRVTQEVPRLSRHQHADAMKLNGRGATG